ncbi:MAG: uroporphyrin-III C-methyltransferase/precorrin-2 dehydrogenase/sirohydrochlorin ferrochelatase, partial [Francisellaceae bacterium]
RINELMVEYAKKGQIVCRLKGGDPFVFGRGGEEMEYLKDHDINYVIIPGITAAIGCAASAGIPLTHRGVSHSITVVTAKLKSNHKSNLIPLAGNNQTLAIYMGINSADNIQEQLLKAGYAKDLPVAIIEHGTTIKQRIITGELNELGCLVDRYQIMSPAIMYVGQVASFAAEGSRNELHEQKNMSNVEELNAQANIHHLSA